MHKEIKKHTEGEEKISQLLGEYMEEKKKNPEGFLDISTALMAGFKATDAYMISKQFGFIEWLVQNDRIDLVKFSDKLSNSNGTMEDRYRYLNSDFGLYHTLLMILAISDNPIEDLISYLK